MELDARYLMFVPVVIALVEVGKDFGIVGKWGKVAALVVSALLVYGTVLIDTYPSISPWIVGAFQVVLLALTAMGGYDLYKLLPNALNRNAAANKE